MTDGPIEARVITVSREALRADLAEMRGDINQAMADMELRLTRQLGDLLARKADLAHAQELEARLRAVERDAVFRDGPWAREMRTWIQENEDVVQQHGQLIPEFRALQGQVARNSERIRSDAELRSMIREERGQASGAQWNTLTKIIALTTTVVAILGLWLAWHRSNEATSEPHSLKEGTPIAQIMG